MYGMAPLEGIIGPGGANGAMKKARKRLGGQLRIGDDWSAINIIALSQQNPLKAVAELVENSIDAHANNIVITRGRERGRQYLRVTDDGDGIPRDSSGRPDFQYVATHICDSLKRRLRKEERVGVQGEFGIGLLSFWILGEELILTSAGAAGTYEMRMRKGNSRYSITERRRLFPEKGTEVVIQPLLPGIRNFGGEKIQWYLASELRDRIKRSGVRIQVIDRQARTQHQVVPREFAGRLLHHLPPVETDFGEVYLEVYLDESRPENRVELHRRGTRVIEDITVLDFFQRNPWRNGCLQGIVDAPFLTLTPGTRSGILHDERYDALCRALGPAETALQESIEEQQRAAEERASREILRSIHRAFREALLALPAEEYDWFQLSDGRGAGRPSRSLTGLTLGEDAAVADGPGATPQDSAQRAFFDFPGPLYSLVISPSSGTMPVESKKNFRALPRDRQRRLVQEDVTYAWEIAEGAGELSQPSSEIVTFSAPPDPGLIRLRLRARQADTQCEAEALVTVTAALIPDEPKPSRDRQGLPAYTFERAAGELWRSRYEEARNLIVINNAHRDFIYASRSRTIKLRYICRLYVKELVHRNFPGLSAERLLERMVELSLYTEEHLR